MRIEIKDKNESYVINLQQITQLLGMNIKKKSYILNSLEKFFSNAKYSSYEADMQDNIKVEGQKVGRKYFSSHRVRTREELIKEIKISKTSMMMQYLLSRYTEFECQSEQDAIVEHLEKLYLHINEELRKTIGNIEIGYDTKNLLEIITESMVYGGEGKEIEQLSNYELLETYLDLICQLQKREPKKMLIILENIDHLLDYAEYEKIYLKIKQIAEQYDSWFLCSTSIQGFAILSAENLEEIQVVNDIVFEFPAYEHVLMFIKEEYPVERDWEEKEILTGFQEVIQRVGKEDNMIDMKENVFLKMINKTLAMQTGIRNTISTLEIAFLMDENVV